MLEGPIQLGMAGASVMTMRVAWMRAGLASVVCHATFLGIAGYKGDWRSDMPASITDAPGTTTNLELVVSLPPVVAPAPRAAPQQVHHAAPAPPEEPKADGDFGAARPRLIDDAPKEPASLVSDTPAGAGAIQPAPAQEPMLEPRASFAGVEAFPARRIVYLVDGSGPMAASLEFVKEELGRSVERLHREQEFEVIVFRVPASASQGAVRRYALPRGRDMVFASFEAKRDVTPWMETVFPSGRSELLAGLEAALALRPDLVFVLGRSIARSGGIDVQSRNAEVLGALDRLNPPGGNGSRLAKIKTIQFMDDDPTGLMQAIAERHGGDSQGNYRVVTRAEISAARKR